MSSKRKYTTVNISKGAKEFLDKNLPKGMNRNYWLELAINEKIERERTHENPVLERNQPEKWVI